MKSNMKTCGRTKVWVLNPNLASKISHERILNNFENEAVNLSVAFTLKGLFHPACLAHAVPGLPLLLPISWPTKMETTKANEETTRARNAG